VNPRRRSPRLRSAAPPYVRPELDQIEGRNSVLEALRASDRVQRMLIDEHARPEERLDEIRERAAERGLDIELVPRIELDHIADGRIHNGVIARGRPLPERKLPDIIDQVLDEDPATALFLLLDEVQYEQNLGAILRTSDAAGVRAIVVPKRRGAAVSPVVVRIAMGAAEYVPVVRCAVLEAMSMLRKAGIPIVGASEHGEIPYHRARLTGPLALVMGGEDKGLTPPVRKKCDQLVRLPMRGHVPSLNVSVSAAVLLYERLRQEEVG